MVLKPTEWNFEWIDAPAMLERVCDSLKDEPLLSIDTETVGWESGNERLCLIQIGNPVTQQVFLIDPLAVPDLGRLEVILSKATPALVAHNASFEERQFARHGIKLRGLIDTLAMARKLRPDLPNHTLQTCCKLLLDIEISKAEQTSDWSARPLSNDQLRYAALDAEVALRLYAALAEMEQKLEVDVGLGVPELMQQLSQTVRNRFELLHDISPELALLNAREEMIRSTIRSKLIEGEPGYDGQYGSCKVNKIKNTEVNPDKVRRELPTIAELVISEHVDKKRLRAVMKEHGIDERMFDKVSDIIGYVDRMTLTLGDIM